MAVRVSTIPPPPAEDAADTEARLIAAAGEVFAEVGFHGATVRDICSRAGANIAAVHYHFGDKMGLYVATLRHCIAGTHTNVRALAEGAATPEEAIRLVIRGMLRKMQHASAGSAPLRMMAHELAQPTPALDRVVIREVIGPLYLFLRETISRIIGLPAEHDTTRMCAHSIIGQVTHYSHAKPVLARLWPEMKINDERIEQIADHIATFSLAGLKEIAKQQAATQAGRRRKGHE